MEDPKIFYSKDHLWMKLENGKVRVGITDYAQKMLRDVLYIELPSEGSTVKQGEPFGSIESIKVVSDLVSPISGVVIEVNNELMDRPELVNEDPYSAGWMLVIDPSNLEAELGNLMSPEAAAEWLKEVIKGA
ncbi:glycine cleavage system protein H [Candidatus Bathyarchaeota archaeon ex4484_205]|nr:MAG: glycine cleavage system protein H [Candidatus Bathyarchaeota archaeon ex4484_205]HDN18330.1 glycine cleavage system protein GcvH [Candidatus Bathyarchaeota archaeon]